jgi:DNA gyrase/topoisomerase IV subunit A
VNPSQGVVEPEKPALSPYVARDLTPDEAAALEIVQEILVKSQDGPIRLTSKMVAMENDEEFLDFMEKLESVKASAKIGTNDFSAGGYVWSLVRDKFSDFYQIAQAVRSGQYEFPSEPLPILEPTQSSAEEEQLMVLCRATAKELSKSKESVKKLEEELRQAKAKYSEDERRHKVFCSELDKLRHPAK